MRRQPPGQLRLVAVALFALATVFLFLEEPGTGFGSDTYAAWGYQRREFTRSSVYKLPVRLPSLAPFVTRPRTPCNRTVSSMSSRRIVVDVTETTRTAGLARGPYEAVWRELLGIDVVIVNARDIAHGALHALQDHFSMLWVQRQACSKFEERYEDIRETITQHALMNFIPRSCTAFYEKTSLCEAISMLPAEKREQGFLPCFLLPREADQFHAFAADHDELWWVSKLSSRSSSVGIEVHQEARTVNISGGADIVQQYVTNPLLWDGYKMDVRLFVFLRMDPPRAYVHRIGEVKVARVPFNLASTERASHFSNVDIGINKPQRRHTFVELREHLGDGPVWEEKIWPTLKSLSGRAAAAVMLGLDRRAQEERDDPLRYRNRFHLLGMDVILDTEYKAYLMEVNSDPSVEVLWTTLLASPPYNSLTRSKLRMYGDVYGDMAILAGFDPRRCFFDFDRPLHEEFRIAREETGFEVVLSS